MSSCNSSTLAGLCRECDASKGGIKKAIAIIYDDVTGTTVTDGKISAIALRSGATAYEYNFRKNTGSMTSTLNVDPANGINYVSTELILQFTRMETQKRIEMSALAVNEMVFLVQDSNNHWWYLGKDQAVSATAGTGQTGTAAGDGNFYQITITDESDTFPFEVTEEAIASLNAGCPED